MPHGFDIQIFTFVRGAIAVFCSFHGFVFWSPFLVLGLDFYAIASEFILVWIVSIMLGWYYVVLFMCVDSEGCRC
jgi:hypothetical protein